MGRKSLILFFCFLVVLTSKAQDKSILQPNQFAHYVEYFNYIDDEPIQNAIPNSACWDWMQENIPWQKNFCPNW